MRRISWRSRATCNLILFLVPALAALGQSTRQPLAFEVASIKENPGPFQAMVQYSSSGSRLTLRAYPMNQLVMEAFGLDSTHVRFAAMSPDPMQTFYDVVANAPEGVRPGRDQFRQMLQALLVERFGLKFHRETRELPVYALVARKGGLKLKESSGDAAPSNRHTPNGRNLVTIATKWTMADLAQDLQSAYGLDRQVIDKTGLTGLYDIKLEATQEFRLNRDPEAADITVFYAVQSQLGLRLEPEKRTVEILVVDRFNKPSAN